MKSFDEKYIKQIFIPPEMISSLTALAEYKGKEALYQKQSKDTLDTLTEIAKIESAEFSNRIEGVVVPHKRVEALFHNRTPKNRSEQEVAGYRDALSRIHEMHEGMPLSINVIFTFHSLLYKYTNVKSGEWKKSENEIIERLADGTIRVRFKPVVAVQTPHYMDVLAKEYNFYFDKNRIDTLILIPLFILDFLCVHPFRDGNGRVARLLALLLLYHAGFTVGRYISLERIIEQSKETYYESLYDSSQKWHEGQHNVLPWMRYFYGVLTAAYKEFETRVGIFKEQGTKTDRLIQAIKRVDQPFSASDLQEACQDTKIDLIRKVLKDLRKNGDIEPIGRGRYAKWRRIR